MGKKRRYKAKSTTTTVELFALEAIRRLARIRAIIENVDNRCMAADGPVTPTLDEMTTEEMREIYKLTNLV